MANKTDQPVPAAAPKGPETLIHPGDLAKIKDAPSAVDSFIATLDWFVSNATIKQEVRDIVVLGLEASRKKLEPALVANVNN